MSPIREDRPRMELDETDHSILELLRERGVAVVSTGDPLRELPARPERDQPERTQPHLVPG
jgi:hypothetical protein